MYYLLLKLANIMFVYNFDKTGSLGGYNTDFIGVCPNEVRMKRD